MTEGLPTDMRRFGMPGRLHDHNRPGPGFTFAVPYGFPSAFGFPDEIRPKPLRGKPRAYSESCCDAVPTAQIPSHSMAATISRLWPLADVA